MKAATALQSSQPNSSLCSPDPETVRSDLVRAASEDAFLAFVQTSDEWVAFRKDCHEREVRQLAAASSSQPASSVTPYGPESETKADRITVMSHHDGETLPTLMEAVQDFLMATDGSWAFSNGLASDGASPTLELIAGSTRHLCRYTTCLSVGKNEAPPFALAMDVLDGGRIQINLTVGFRDKPGEDRFFNERSIRFAERDTTRFDTFLRGCALAGFVSHRTGGSSTETLAAYMARVTPRLEGLRLPEITVASKPQVLADLGLTLERYFVPDGVTCRTELQD